jgi:hypothetical protein
VSLGLELRAFLSRQVLLPLEHLASPWMGKSMIKPDFSSFKKPTVRYEKRR